MAKLEFTKMHGLGNDFVVVDLRGKKFPRLAEAARLICDRRFGIGCDQLIVIRKPRRADYRMRIFNPDGSEAEMCGNGIRCFAKYLWDRRDPVIRRKKSLDVETPAGIIRPRMAEGGMVEVDMGEPVLEGEDIPSLFDGRVVDKPLKAGAKTYRITAVSMGNPHAVIFTDDVDGVDLAKEGPAIENSEKFPNRTNVEFVEVKSRRRVKTRVWERGAGATLACGTGACAVAVASALNGRTGRKVAVELPGGTLSIEWTRSNRVLMTGPAVEVFEGAINL